ncbi:MAG: hypothetical protein FWD74_12365, partial [Actinomycetia bacterium]|nr:hypothetical protein [Actinomycetes bacterium]
APWALAIAARLRARHGLEAQPMHSDDGIVLRLPDTGAEPPGAELVVFDPDEIEALVTAEVGGSALFAARFRECAARSLLLPRRDPSRRRALWQQRQRASQLLQVARGYAEFPVVLEAMRECLQDVFDLAGLASLMSDLAARRVRLVTVQTPAASPFARSLLFGYVGAFLYEGDAPLAERRAQALALNPTLLADLLGSADLRELLDASVVAAVVDEAQRLVASRHARGVDAAHDLLRGLGDLSTDEALARGATAAELAELQAQRRAIRVRIGGEQRWLAVEDASRVRDALGVALPAEVPAAFAEPVRDPLGDLIGRYARTHGPFVASDVATRLGLGRAVVDDALLRLRADGQLIAGRFPRGHAGISAGNGGGGRAESTAGVSAEAEWCDAEVLRTIRRRSLAALRREVEPAPPIALARFLPAWQGVGEVGGAGRRERGVGGVARVIEQLAGAPLVASALESLVLPSRVADYSPALLDELTAAGEVLWAGAGSLSRGDGWIVLAPTEQAPLLLPEPSADGLGEPHRALLSALGADAALFFRALADRVHAARATAAGRTAADPADADPPGAELSDPVTTRFSDDALAAAIWDLVWAGWVTNDTLAPLRSLMHTGYGRSSPRSQAPRARYGRRSGYARYPGLAAPRGAASTALNLGGSPGTKTRLGPAGASALVGRWSQLPPREADATRRAVAAAEAMVERHGVLTRGAVVAERWPGGFAAVYPVLKAAEESGRLRRGYFVEELGGAQFAQPGAVDRLRERATPDDAPADAAPDALVLAATDPANPYGAALAWPSPAPPLELGDPTNPGRRHQPGRDPDSDRSDPVSRGHQPARKGGALVVLVGGACVLYVERGGRAFLSFTDDPDLLRTAAEALVAAARARAFTRLVVERADGVRVVGTALGEALTAAGFSPTPRGLRLRLQ